MENQPGRTHIKSKEVLNYLISDIITISNRGKDNYGIRLETHNGRDALWDAYEEAVDLCFYLKQAIMEREDAKNNSTNS